MVTIPKNWDAGKRSLISAIASYGRGAIIIVL